ncbi:MAG: Abi family protein, partial [Fusobacterium periodonticum]|nr:Abi family protein [Fusobacterium periodonticum]
MKIKYIAFHLSYEEQLQKFIDRGMEVKDKEFCLTKLSSIKYY